MDALRASIAGKHEEAEGGVEARGSGEEESLG